MWVLLIVFYLNSAGGVASEQIFYESEATCQQAAAFIQKSINWKSLNAFTICTKVNDD